MNILAAHFSKMPCPAIKKKAAKIALRRPIPYA
jgi:hypothetical protein